MKTKFSIFFFLFLTLSSLFAQESQPYETKIADLGEIQMEYKDFGGEGPTLIWVQDFHNYFEGPYGSYSDAQINIELFAKLSKDARVLAPLRRGYGKSTHTKWGYDVATQSMDLLAFMDALGIEKVILMGRQPANQDMTWIAEHYPERLSGLVYYGGNPILIVGSSYPDELLLTENWSAMAPDFEKEQEKILVMSRAFWRPNFLKNPDTKIEVPAIRIINTKYSNTSINRRLTEPGLLESMLERERPGYENEIAALRELVNDSLRMSKLRNHLIATDPSIELHEGMERAFGENLITVEKYVEIESDDQYKAYLNWVLLETQKFLKKIEY